MKTELTCADITEELCRKCAYCCLNTLIPVTLDDRTYEYFLTVGIDVKRDAVDPEIGIINGGACQHLIQDDGCYGCGIYESRPKLCKDYNCVAWAKVAGEDSEIVRYALNVYNSLLKSHGAKEVKCPNGCGKTVARQAGGKTAVFCKVCKKEVTI